MNDHDDLGRILRSLEAAENAGDAEYIISMLAEDAVIMVPNEAVQEGKLACAEFLRGMLAWMIESLDRHIEYVSAEVRVLGEYAFDRGTFVFTATPKSDGNTAHAQGKYLCCTRATPMARGSWRA